jgi:hypothetical protein
MDYGESTQEVPPAGETDEVEPGRIFRPRGEYTGSKLGAFNVRGANLVRNDFIERDIEGERLDGGGNSRVTVRVANVLSYTILKTFAFQDRHENKDAYALSVPARSPRSTFATSLSCVRGIPIR